MNVAHQNVDLEQPRGLASLNCVWMDAGVVDFKLCDRAYDCEHCAFDEALHGSHSPSESQRLHGQHVQVQGCELPPDLFYDHAHTWARVEAGGTIRVGIDDFGQRLLGAAYSITLPAARARVKIGERCWSFAHQFGSTSVPSPISGRVRHINSALIAQPGLINRDPYGTGWLMVIEPSDLRTCLKRLMYGEEAGDWLAEESEKLRLTVNRVTNNQLNTPRSMNDGGLLTREFLNELNVDQVRRVISSFFPFSRFEEAETKPAIVNSDRR